MDLSKCIIHLAMGKRTQFILLLFTVFINIDGYAQLKELTYSILEQAEQTVSVFKDHPDAAGIIVRSSITTLKLDSNVEVISNRSEPENGYYRIIVHPFRQILIVSAPGYFQLRIPIDVSSPREVKLIEIEPAYDETESIGARGTGDLILNSYPQGASIKIDGLPDFSGRTPYTFNNYGAQNYNITLSKQDFLDSSFVMQIEPNTKTELNIRLTPNFSWVDFRILNSNGETLNDVQFDFSDARKARISSENFRFAFLNGISTVKLSKTGYKDRELEFFVERDTTYSQEVIMLTNSEHSLLPVAVTIKSDKGAKIIVNKKDIGEEIIEKEFVPGTYRIHIEHPYSNLDSEIFIRPEQTQEFYFPVLPSRKKALVYGIIPGGGQIYIKRNRGWVYLGVTLLTTTLSAINYAKFIQSDNDLQDALYSYNYEVHQETDFENLRQEIEYFENRSNRHYGRASDFLKYTMISYSFSIADLFIFKPKYGYRQ